MDALMGDEGDFVVNSGGDREPVKCAEYQYVVFLFLHSHQDPSSAVLDILELLKTLARDSDEKCIVVVQPGGDKGVDEFCNCSNCRWESNVLSKKDDGGNGGWLNLMWDADKYGFGFEAV